MKIHINDYKLVRGRKRFEVICDRTQDHEVPEVCTNHEGRLQPGTEKVYFFMIRFCNARLYPKLLQYRVTENAQTSEKTLFSKLKTTKDLN